MMTVTSIAIICHELNRVYCQEIGDDSQVPWDDAPQWQRDSAIQGVIGIQEGSILAAADSHKNWMVEKVKAGWIYGEIKDATLKTHPCLVVFSCLPFEQQKKDYLFYNTASVLLNREW